MRGLPRHAMVIGAVVVLLGGIGAAAPRQQSRERPPATLPGAAGGGLETLDDARILTEVAGRGLTDLLRHAFERQNVPEDQRLSLLARISLTRLQSPEPISTAERRQLVRDVAANVGETVAAAREAQLLFEQAQLLMDRGVSEETRLLEYFGDNPELRRYLRPVADAVSRMLVRAAELYKAEADELANRINNPSDPVVARWRAADQAAKQARDYQVFADYNRVLAMDPDAPQRLMLADQLMERVAPADNPSNPRRAFVQGYLGKVALARGNDTGLGKAREYFESVLAASGVAPTERFEAHYFRTVVEIEERKIDQARTELARFQEWFAQQNLPDHRPLMMVLEYRVEDAASAYGPTQQARQNAQARATQILVDLVEQYEGYRPIVTEQLLARVDAGTDLGQLSPLLLDALVDRGRSQAALLSRRSGDTPGTAGPDVDRQAIERGIDAARELLRRWRAGDTQLEGGMVARSAFLLGLMLDLLDRDLEAAQAFLTLRDVPGVRPAQVVASLRRAQAIVEQLKRSGRLNDEQRLALDAIEDHLLPLLVGPPVDDPQWAFDLANRLHRLGRLDEAARHYRMVPDSDPRKRDASYLLLLAESGRLAELPAGAPARVALVAELPRAGQRALAELSTAINQSQGEAQAAYRERAARVKILLARLAINESDNPTRALELLDRIEHDVEGLPAAEAILASALPLRFQATAAIGQIDRATRDLLTLLERSEPQRGLGYIAQFRETLNRAMERAQARGDAEAVRGVTETRAAVTPRLVEWIERSQDPEYQRYVYNFRRFDAETQYQAALLAEDPGDRRQRLRLALAAYERLEQPENLDRFRQLLVDVPEAQRQAVAYDREVVFALGNIHFALANFEEARSRYGRLLADRAMGNAVRVVEQDGVMRQEANDEFWELYLKFFQANLELGNAPEKMGQELRTLYVAHGGLVGGNRWRDEYEALRQRLIPDFRPATGPATRPSQFSGTTD